MKHKFIAKKYRFDIDLWEEKYMVYGIFPCYVYSLWFDGELHTFSKFLFKRRRRKKGWPASNPDKKKKRLFNIKSKG